MDRLQQMRVFVAVAEEASFAGGARRLNLSPTQVTRAVASLEEHLGAALLKRSSRRVRLTEAGEGYLVDCRAILARVEAAEGAVMGASAVPQGWLGVTAPVLFGQMHVLPVVLDFLRAHPLVRGRTLFVDRVVSLLEEGLDVAVRIGPLVDSGLFALPAGEVHRVLVAAPGAPRDRLIVNAEQGPWRAGEPALVVNGNPSAIAAAVAGFGVARVVSYQVVEEVASGRLEVLEEDRVWPVHVLYQRGPAKVVAFAQFLAERLRQVNRSTR